MNTIIYRKTDKLIVGYVYSRRTPQQSQQAVAVEIDNICQSELGGVPADYTQVQVEQARKPGLQATITDDGTVGFTPLTPKSSENRTRIADLLDIPRTNWTAAQRTELLELIARVITP